MQWLRHTRFEPPSIADQQAEVARRERIKLLAAQADARWAAKPSALDAPDIWQPEQQKQPAHMLPSGESQPPIDREARVRSGEGQDVAEPVKTKIETDAMPNRRVRKEPKDSPWKKAAKENPGEGWQPASWSPPPAKRRA